MSAALRLVRDSSGDDGGLPPREQWELYMRGARPLRPLRARQRPDYAQAAAPERPDSRNA
jgi:hypothetical protein